MDRREKLIGSLSKDSRIIEIGPSYNPLAPKAEGWNTFIIDHDDRESLVKKYLPHTAVDTTKIEDVDFVWHGGPLANAVPNDHLGTFDAFLASHVIEHTTDVVSFLKSAEALVGDRGTVVLAIPDKRKCFDAFRPLSTTGEAIVAFKEERSLHTARVHFDHVAFQISRNGPGWPIDSDVKPEFVAPFTGVDKVLSLANSGLYVDAHQWIFTPSSFELMILELSALGYLDLRIEKSEEAWATEFYAWLKKGAERISGEVLQSRRLDLMNKIVVDLAEQSRQVPGSPLLRAEARIAELEAKISETSQQTYWLKAKKAIGF